VLILHKTADGAADAIPCHQNGKAEHGLPAGKTILRHDRLLEHAPRRRNAGQQLHGGTGGQNFGVAVLFWHGVLPPYPSSSTQFDTASVCPVFVDKKRRDRYDKEVYLLIFPRAAARADNREEQP
jgi:hypothetical protein